MITITFINTRSLATLSNQYTMIISDWVYYYKNLKGIENRVCFMRVNIELLRRNKEEKNKKKMNEFSKTKTSLIYIKWNI